MHSMHAMKRMQQRGIPHFASHLLDLYGAEQFDGRGGVLLYFDKSSLLAMKRDMSDRYPRQVEHLRGLYKVVSAIDGVCITVGHRTKHIFRR